MRDKIIWWFTEAPWVIKFPVYAAVGWMIAQVLLAIIP